jgi:hypothetical protein
VWNVCLSITIVASELSCFSQIIAVSLCKIPSWCLLVSICLLAGMLLCCVCTVWSSLSLLMRPYTLPHDTLFVWLLNSYAYSNKRWWWTWRGWAFAQCVRWLSGWICYLIYQLSRYAYLLHVYWGIWTALRNCIAFLYYQFSSTKVQERNARFSTTPLLFSMPTKPPPIMLLPPSLQSTNLLPLY